MYRYTAYGLNILATHPIPELIAVDGRAEPDITITIGVRPDVQDASQSVIGAEPIEGTERRVYRRSPSGMVAFSYSDGTEFFISPRGDHIWATWHPPYTVEDMATYLLGPILGYVLRLRQTVALHASVFAVEDQAVHSPSEDQDQGDRDDLPPRMALDEDPHRDRGERRDQQVAEAAPVTHQRASPTIRARPSGANGFWRSQTPCFSTPCRIIPRLRFSSSRTSPRAISGAEKWIHVLLIALGTDAVAELGGGASFDVLLNRRPAAVLVAQPPAITANREQPLERQQFLPQS